MRKGIGPNRLGAVKSPIKKTEKAKEGSPDTKGKDPYKENMDAFNNRMANKATGGIKVDNTIESLVMGGPIVKGVTKAVKGAAGAVGAGRAASAIGSRAGHGVAEAAHVGEIAHSAAHMKKSENKK
jgi:hypothetical protein